MKVCIAIVVHMSMVIAGQCPSDSDRSQRFYLAMVMGDE